MNYTFLAQYAKETILKQDYYKESGEILLTNFELTIGCRKIFRMRLDQIPNISVRRRTRRNAKSVPIKKFLYGNVK